jgi:hypothetical protein
MSPTDRSKAVRRPLGRAVAGSVAPVSSVIPPSVYRPAQPVASPGPPVYRPAASPPAAQPKVLNSNPNRTLDKRPLQAPASVKAVPGLRQSPPAVYRPVPPPQVSAKRDIGRTNIPASGTVRGTVQRAYSLFGGPHPLARLAFGPPLAPGSLFSVPPAPVAPASAPVASAPAPVASAPAPDASAPASDAPPPAPSQSALRRARRRAQKARGGAAPAAAAPVALPPTTATAFNDGFLSGGGAYFAHIHFADGTMLSVKRNRTTMRFVYLDVRGGPESGAGLSTYGKGYTAPEMRTWLEANYPGVVPYWREYRQNHPK